MTADGDPGKALEKISSVFPEFRIPCTIAGMRILSTVDVMARFGKALADPTRAAVLEQLKDGPAFPADLADNIGVSRQILSNHLACLRDCGLVAAEPVGRRVRYELADARLAHALEDLLGVILPPEATAECLNPRTELPAEPNSPHSDNSLEA